MPRNGAGIFSLDARYLVSEGDTILPSQHNPVLEDLQTDANTPRPIVAGGTGASTATTARTNLSVYSIADVDDGFTPKVATRTALKALDTATTKAVVLTEASRQKLFMWMTGNFTDSVAGDPSELAYIPADGIDPALGCWVAVTGAGASIVPVIQGGTGANDAATALGNLGGMAKATYDPNGVLSDAFDMANMVEATDAKIMTAAERTKLAGIEAGADVTDATNVDAAGATMNTDTDVSANSWVLDEDDMASDSAAKVPTQQSVSSAKLQKAADRTALKALSGATHPAVFLYEAGREGLFSWDSSDLSTEVDADTAEGVYVAPTSDATGASGAWVRLHDGVLNINWFGASTSLADNSTAVNAALAMDAGAVFIPSGNYSCVETITLPNKGAVLFGAGSSGAGTDQANYPNNSRLIFTGSTARTACITQSDTGANFLHASIKDLGILTEAGATYDWVIDLYNCIGLTLSGLTVSQENFASGGGIRSRRVASTDVNWINRVIDCEVQVFVGGTAYALDVSWTDCQFVASNFNGGAGCIVRGNGENSFLGVQFNNAPSGLRVQKETTSAMQIMLTGCAFDACTTYGLLVDASGSPGGTDLCVTVTGCAFRNPGATYDIKFVDGPAKISGPRIANSQFSVSTVTTAVNYNQAKWVVDFSNNYFASGWYPPSRTFTPAISFGGSTTGITYTVQTGTYCIKDNIVTFNILIQLSSKGTATGAALISGLPVASSANTQLAVGHVTNMSGLTGALVAESSGGGIVLFQAGATGVANLTDASFTNSSVFRISGSYAVA